MRKSPLLIAALVLAMASACKKKKDADPAPATSPAPTSTAQASDAGAATPDAAGPTDAERVAKGLKDAEEAHAKEVARWTDEIKQQAVAVRDGAYKDTQEALTAILASKHRVPEHPARDAHRHPIETLTFFGVTPESTVVELGAGGGWYTELLAPLLASKGKLVVAGPNAAGPADKMTTVYGKRLDLFLAKSPELFGKVERVTIDGPDAIKLGPDGSADVVIAMRELHGWARRNETAAYLAAVHAVLKDGGAFGVEQHRAAAGAKVEDTAEKGYLDEQWVIDTVTAAGFELAEKSEINANPKDTKDYPKGVWTLPPNLREGDKDRDKYAAIGESDRMTLRFKKVAKK